MASFTADRAAVNMGQHARIKALILGDKCFIDQLNTARDFQLTNNCKIIFQFVNVEYNEV